MWSVSQATAQSGTLTSEIFNRSPAIGKPLSEPANSSFWQRPRRYSTAILPGRLVLSPFQ